VVRLIKIILFFQSIPEVEVSIKLLHVLNVIFHIFRQKKRKIVYIRYCGFMPFLALKL